MSEERKYEFHDVRNLEKVGEHEWKGWKFTERRGLCPWLGKPVVSLVYEGVDGHVAHCDCDAENYNLEAFNAMATNLAGSLEAHQRGGFLQ